MDLPQIMNQAEEQPLGVDLDLPSKREAIQPKGAAQVRKDRLDDPHPSAVDPSPFDGVDLADHLLGKALFNRFRLAGEEGHLSCFGVRLP